MLKGIPCILSPELLKILMEMGHGDELVLADGNFPSANYGRFLVRLDGHGVPPLLEAILTFFPLDSFVEKPVTLMEVSPESGVEVPIWDEYHRIVEKLEPAGCNFNYLERFAFYEQARKAYAVVATGENALYANIILKKGVVME